jgi:glyoxylase-like metal-dependent hydrolase (beta-lactamase superfamily II)
MRIGEIEILPVIDGTARVEPTEAFTGTTDDDWAPHRGLLDDNGLLELALGGFLIRTGDRVALIDVGVGAQSPLPLLSGGAFLESLSSHGVGPDEVTDVIFSHLHFDHIGWASVDGAPVFPNATYRCDGRDWEYFVDPPPALASQPLDEANPLAPLVAPGSGKSLLEPVAHRLDMWDGDSSLLPGVDVRLAPGHTPGSGVMVVSSGSARAVLLGDVAHCPVELLEDEWAGIGDVDPELARRTRVALMREYGGLDVPMTAAHFPGLKFGRLLEGQGKRQWVV